MRIVEQCGMEWSIESVQELHYTRYTDTHTITYSKNRDSAFKLNCYGGLQMNAWLAMYPLLPL